MAAASSSSSSCSIGEHGPQVEHATLADALEHGAAFSLVPRHLGPGDPDLCVQLENPPRYHQCPLHLGVAKSPPLTHQLFWLAPVLKTVGNVTQPRLVHGRRIYRIMVVHSGLCLEEKPDPVSHLFAGLRGHPVQREPLWATDNESEGSGAIQQYWVIQVSNADEFVIRIIAASCLGQEDALVPPDRPLLRPKMISLDVDSGRKTAGTVILKWYVHGSHTPGQAVADKPTQNFAMMHRFDYISPVRAWKSILHVSCLNSCFHRACFHATRSSRLPGLVSAGRSKSALL
jgi:hypothetical protein